MQISPDVTLFFDCDGVILKSNEIKSAAFYEVALQYTTEENAQTFLTYHKSNGGVSRDKKFNYLFSSLLGESNIDQKVQNALLQYQELIFDKLIACEAVEGVIEFILNTPNKKYVVSGGKQDELREIFKVRNLDVHFSAIYGSPRTKYDLINEISPELRERAMFFGDSKLDYEVASFFNMDFVFIYGNSELQNWREILADKTSNGNPIKFVSDFRALNHPTKAFQN